jgi:titin
VISGNATDGILVQDTAPPSNLLESPLIQGNRIGTDASGQINDGNGVDGVQLLNAPGVTLGGSALMGLGNVISGNATGVEIDGTGAPLATLLQGNTIGLGFDGQTVVRNLANGVLLTGQAQGVTIGGVTTGLGNLISSNGSSGILISSSSGNLVEGNRIGTVASGLAAAGNNLTGVTINDGSTSNTVGGAIDGAGNVISGNTDGVDLSNQGTTGNLILGNLIGLGLDGSTALGNLSHGVLINTGASNNTIGGASSGDRDIISANSQGIAILGPVTGDNLISGDYVGLNQAGTSAAGNVQLGLLINASSGNTVGGTASGSGNVISGNLGFGVQIYGPSASGNLVAGNLIGLDASGSKVLGLSGATLGNGFGVEVDGAPANTIGGGLAGSRNVISGNRQEGININGAASAGTVVSGNYIGLDVTGTVALGNFSDGILVDRAPGVVIGGTGPLARNVISANLGNGVDLSGVGTVGTQVLGNYIGLNAAGSAAIGNLMSGVAVASAAASTIGGLLAGQGNVISGNVQDGINFSGDPSAGGLVVGNLIGIDATGQNAAGNGGDGVLVDGTPFVTIGGTVSGSTNVIAANLGNGVNLQGQGASDNVVLGNLIGTNLGGSKALGNGTGVLVNNAPFNQVGSPAPFGGNLISGNYNDGVHVEGPGSIGVAIQANRVGTNLLGLAAIPNQIGVLLDSSADDTVGGFQLGDGNLISGNLTAGVDIANQGAMFNLVQGNLIGTDVTGEHPIPVFMQQVGVLIDNVGGNVIGGTVPLARNVISGNAVGIDIAGFNATGNLAVGNYIGTDVSGSLPVANTFGIYISSAPDNTIGGPSPAASNLISGNGVLGVEILGTLATGNEVVGNLVGTDATGLRALPNPTGIYDELGSSNVIGGATPSLGNTISGNTIAGIYLFDNVANTAIHNNRIGVNVAGGALGNAEYGVLLYNSASNTVSTTGPGSNLIANSGIANVREFTGTAATAGSNTPTTSSNTSKSTKVTKSSVVPAGPKLARKVSRKVVS